MYFHLIVLCLRCDDKPKSKPQPLRQIFSVELNVRACTKKDPVTDYQLSFQSMILSVLRVLFLWKNLITLSFEPFRGILNRILKFKKFTKITIFPAPPLPIFLNLWNSWKTNSSIVLFSWKNVITQSFEQFPGVLSQILKFWKIWQKLRFFFGLRYKFYWNLGDPEIMILSIEVYCFYETI